MPFTFVFYFSTYGRIVAWYMHCFISLQYFVCIFTLWYYYVSGDSLGKYLSCIWLCCQVLTKMLSGLVHGDPTHCRLRLHRIDYICLWRYTKLHGAGVLVYDHIPFLHTPIQLRPYASVGYVTIKCKPFYGILSLVDWCDDHSHEIS